MVPQAVVNDSNGGIGGRVRNGTGVSSATGEVGGGGGEQRPNALQMMQVLKILFRQFATILRVY